jgi:cell division transport system permease protein
MKLIGATNLFIRAPFMVEGVMIGLIGSAVPLIVLFFMYQKIIVYVSTKFRFLSDVLTFLPVSDVFRVLVPVALILGVGIGFLGSILTIRRHLDV